MDREPWRAAVHGVAKSWDTTEWLNWTEMDWKSLTMKERESGKE